MLRASPNHIVSPLVCLANYLHRRQLEEVQRFAIDVLGIGLLIVLHLALVYYNTLWILLHLYGVFGPNLLPMPLLANSSRKEKREESIWAACKTPQSLMPACLGGRKKMKWNARQLRRQGEQEGRLASCACYHCRQTL